VPTGGPRHELSDSCRPLGADSARIETALLPDHAGKELDRKGRSRPPTVLVRGKYHRLWAVGADGVRRPRPEGCFPYCLVPPVSRLLVRWRAQLPKQARMQAAVRLYGSLLVSFDSTTAKRTARGISAAVQSKEILNPSKNQSGPVTEERSFARPMPPSLSSMGWVELVPLHPQMTVGPFHRGAPLSTSGDTPPRRKRLRQPASGSRRK
jgi:hypothetical protein